ncbi:MAG: hypothetical protein RLY69_327 [Verrucomicrobiota bacterium]
MRAIVARDDQGADFSRFPKRGGGFDAMLEIKVLAASRAVTGSKNESDLG